MTDSIKRASLSNPRNLGPLERGRIEQEIEYLWLPSKRKLLHKMAQILVGDVSQPHEVLSLFWGFNISELRHSESLHKHQLLVVGQLATHRLMHDKDRPITRINQLGDVRGKDDPLRIDSVGRFGNRSSVDEERDQTLAWVTLTDDAVVIIQGGSVESGVSVIADWMERPVRPQKDLEIIRRPDLHLVHD